MLRGDILALACAAALAATAASAAEPIKIGFPIPLSGPTAVYGEPVLKGAELAVAEINAKGGVLGRKLEILSRDSKANADEAVRLARELIIKNNVDFLVGTLTSAEAPAVSTVAKENKIVFIAPTSKSTILTDAQHIHPYIFRVSSNTDVEGLAAATLMARVEGRQDRGHDRPRLRLWPRLDRRLYRGPEEAAPRHPYRRPAMAETRRARLHRLHHRADGQEAGRGLLLAVRRRLRHLHQGSDAARLLQGDRQPADRRRRGRHHRRGAGARRRLSLRHHRRRLRSGDLGRQRAARAQEIHRGSEGVHQGEICLGLVDRRLPDRSTRWPRASRRPATPRATTWPRRCSA